MGTIRVGTKVFKKNPDNTITEGRIIKRNNKSCFSIRYSNSVVKKVTINDLKKEGYVTLRPDGCMYFTIVRNEKYFDVIVTLHRIIDIENENGTPYCVCRQNVLDAFANQLQNKVQYVGLCISSDTCPENMDYDAMLSCNEICDSTMIDVYLDDTLSDILSLIKTKKYDDVLAGLFYSHAQEFTKAIRIRPYDEVIKERYLHGYCKNLVDLLVSNNFMLDFYRCFGITGINACYGLYHDFDQLLPSDKEILSGIWSKNIVDATILKYDRDFDLSGSNYTLISDSTDTVYIILYREEGKYRIPMEITESIENIEMMAKLMNGKIDETSSIIRTLGWLKSNEDKYTN